jgi:L-threonylcarbamoyladenylate synthase
MTKVLKVDAVEPDTGKIAIAAKAITEGGLVAFPTETVYGLGANALDPEAVAMIFKAKNRPADNPLIVHISKMTQLREVAEGVSPRMLNIAEKVWPGPLTFLFRKSDRLPQAVCGLTDKVAVRMPSHPVALALISAACVPIAAPSANLSTRPSPTSAAHVLADLDGKVDIVLDAGDTFFGVESTIIDATCRPFRLLRPGACTLEELQRLLGRVSVPMSVKKAESSAHAIAPGMKYRHYAPSKPLYMLGNKGFSHKLFAMKNVGIICSRELCRSYRGAGKNVIILGSEKNLYEIARNLFKSLRALDELDVEFGIIETFKEEGIGLAIMNRIKKASADMELPSTVR